MAPRTSTSSGGPARPTNVGASDPLSGAPTKLTAVHGFNELTHTIAIRGPRELFRAQVATRALRGLRLGGK